MKSPFPPLEKSQGGVKPTISSSKKEFIGAKFTNNHFSCSYTHYCSFQISTQHTKPLHTCIIIKLLQTNGQQLDRVVFKLQPRKNVFHKNPSTLQKISGRMKIKTLGNGGGKYCTFPTLHSFIDTQKKPACLHCQEIPASKN